VTFRRVRTEAWPTRAETERGTFDGAPTESAGKAGGVADMVDVGCELRRCSGGKGDAIIATRSFGVGDTVLGGVILRRVSQNHSHATQVGMAEWVELAGLAPKVNHSCDPNCGVRLNASGAPDLVARRPIRAGEEVTFDYAMRNHTIDHFPIRCRCGARICRGRITGWKDLPADRKAAYLGLVAPYLVEIEATALIGSGSSAQRGG
jgi:hypothetical protein